MKDPKDPFESCIDARTKTELCFRFVVSLHGARFQHIRLSTPYSLTHGHQIVFQPLLHLLTCMMNTLVVVSILLR